MANLERSVVISAPVTEVFRFAADYRNWTKFFVGVSDFEALTEETRGNGAKFKYNAKVFWINVPIETELQDFVENRGWTGICAKGMEHRTKWIFEEQGNKTRFTYRLDYQIPVPLLGKLLDKLLVKPQWENIIEQSLENLKRYMEANHSVTEGE